MNAIGCWLLLCRVVPSLEDLQAKFNEDRTSIGFIKPAEVLEFYKKGDLQIYQDPKVFQQSLFGTKIPEIEEIPHLFGYRFRCNGCQSGKEHNIQCEDWELFESYRRWGKLYGDVNLLWEKLQDQYYKSMVDSDLYFYVGTLNELFEQKPK